MASNNTIPFPCGVCLKEVKSSQHGAQCRGKCIRWFHKDCAKISTTEYNRLAGDSNLIWECMRADCVTPGDSHSNQSNDFIKEIRSLASVVHNLVEKVDAIKSSDLAEIKSDVKAVNNKLEAIEHRISNSEKRITTLEEKFTALEMPLNSGVASVTHEDIISEIEDRAKRSRNIILHNLPESKSRDVALKQSYDKKLVRDITEKIDVVHVIEVESIKLYRIGKPKDGKARPLKVILKSVEEVKIFIEKFSGDLVKEINPAFSTVGITRDRTERERLHLNKLREELDTRTTEGETNLSIKYRNGVPVILRNTKNE